MRKFYAISEGRIVEVADEIGSIVEAYFQPTIEEKNFLIEKYQIDEHTLNSALDPDELPRVEQEQDHWALIVKKPKNYSIHDEYHFKIVSIGVFLFSNRVIIVSNEQTNLFSQKPQIALLSPPDVVLRVIYNCIFHFIEHLKIINMVAEEVETKINRSLENKYLINLFALEKSLVYYLNAIHGNGLILTKLRAYANKIGFSPEGKEFLDDLIIENEQCFKVADIHSTVLSNLMDARASIVSNNLNVLMKILNIITIALMVPTFIVSLFSMNVPIPFQSYTITFFAIFFCCVISAIVVLLIFFRYKEM
ncbi:MAG: magnesium transporter CorA family protein [Candidatus Hydrogenedentes bacterium]|nr:magnesium transporter CorA family protein [Candidatus Hydrogenedentota bacterium]